MECLKGAEDDGRISDELLVENATRNAARTFVNVGTRKKQLGAKLFNERGDEFDCIKARR